MFITFEGIDGSGKSTVLNKLKEHIKKNYNINNFVFTREPGGFNMKECEEIRKIVLDKNNIIDPMTEALLYLASRKMHVDRLIKPSIKENKIVLCDRFYDSSFAYQGNARGIGMELIYDLNMKVLNNFRPNFTFYFKIDFKTSKDRMILNNRDLDRLENEGNDFFEKAIEGYNILSNKEKQRYIVIDATKSIDEVSKEVIEIFDSIMKK